MTDGSGTFWFFGRDNVELVAKILDGCALNQRYWFFTAGLTDVGLDFTVTDTATGAVKTYHHNPGTAFAPILDTSALAVCP